MPNPREHQAGPKRLLGRQLAPATCWACGKPWPCPTSWQARAEAAEAKLAAIAEICQRPLLGTAAEVRWAADILAIIGSETQERSEEKGQGNA